jgi:hypothetical protein
MTPRVGYYRDFDRESVSILNETFAENELPESAVGIGFISDLYPRRRGTDARMNIL